MPAVLTVTGTNIVGPQAAAMFRSRDWLLGPQAVAGIDGKHALAGPGKEHGEHGQKLNISTAMAPTGIETSKLIAVLPLGKHIVVHEVVPDPVKLTVKSLMPGTPVVWQRAVEAVIRNASRLSFMLMEEPMAKERTHR